jgi:hypothetical protein
MASEVQIINRGLRKLGQGRITDRSENVKNARVMDDLFDTVRDFLLSIHPWNFAEARASLAASEEAPPFGFKYKFLLPADFLLLNEVVTTLKYKREGEYILSDSSGPLNIIYTRRISDSTKFSPQFVELMATYLGIEGSESIDNSTSTKNSLKDDFQWMFSQVKKFNGFEDDIEELPESDFILSRQ